MMKLFTKNGYYEVVYENNCYQFLEFMRLDIICENTYITLKNVITGEIFSFDEERIVKIRRKMFHYPERS